MGGMIPSGEQIKESGTFVKTVGFPIVVALILFAFMGVNHWQERTATHARMDRQDLRLEETDLYVRDTLTGLVTETNDALKQSTAVTERCNETLKRVDIRLQYGAQSVQQ